MVSVSKKVCLLGDFAVGKTSLVRRFVHNLFDDRYLSTIGVKVSRKVFVLPRGSDIVELTLMLWDLAGSEEFDDVRTSYLRGASGAILVCDMTRQATLDNLRGYAASLRAANAEARLVVAANKHDLVDQHQVREQQVADLAATLGAPWYLTSARTGTSIEDAFRHLSRLIIE